MRISQLWAKVDVPAYKQNHNKGLARLARATRREDAIKRQKRLIDSGHFAAKPGGLTPPVGLEHF
jgi:hypothetical protein